MLYLCIVNKNKMTQKEFYVKVLQYLRYLVLIGLLRLSPSIAETASRVIAYFNARDGTEWTCNYHNAFRMIAYFNVRDGTGWTCNYHNIDKLLLTLNTCKNV